MCKKNRGILDDEGENLLKYNKKGVEIMIYSIIVSTLYFAAVGVFALRLINESGVSLQNGFCKKVCTYSISDERETNIGIKQCIKIFGIAFFI